MDVSSFHIVDSANVQFLFAGAVVEPVGGTECAFSQGQIVDGVEKVSLTLAVVSTDTVHIRAEVKLLQFYVSPVPYYYSFKSWHSGCA